MLRMLAIIMTLLALSPSAMAFSASEERLFALNLYHEARSGGREGMVAVGWVVLNRMKDKAFPSTIAGVVNQGGPKPPCQFGWTCDGRSDEPKETKLWNLARSVTRQLLDGKRPADPTKGALWFHETKFTGGLPYTQKLHRTATVGGNVFYAR